MLEITLPHVGTWNVWYAWYGNIAPGFAALGAGVATAVRRSACVLVAVDGGARERPLEADAPPVAPDDLAAHLRDLAEAGADEAILVLDPITEKSIRTVATALAL
jgi:hypothetical protein